MSPSDPDAQNLDVGDEWKPRRALIAVVELPPAEGQKPGFTVSLALSHQDPEQQQDIDENGTHVLAVVDVVVMALVDIIKTTPPVFVSRIEAIQRRFGRLAQRIASGDDPRDAAAEEFAEELAPESRTDTPWRVWRDGAWTILHVATGGAETTSSFDDDQVQALIAELQDPETP